MGGFMKLGLVLAFPLLLARAEAADIGFAGNWEGQGHWINGSEENELTTTTLLTITLTETSFRFEECWGYKDGGDEKHSCIESSYDRDAHDALFHDGKKVGDIFPDRVVIFDGSAQVGEQIVMEQAGQGKLRYRYSYLNFDGAAEQREAVLSPAQ